MKLCWHKWAVESRFVMKCKKCGKRTLTPYPG